MENIKQAIQHYAPVYNAEEFNQNFNTAISPTEYQDHIDSLGVSSKEETIETANRYAESTKQMYFATIKEIADNNYISCVFES